jgi:hypothetical protein
LVMGGAIPDRRYGLASPCCLEGCSVTPDNLPKR